ncbi:PBSX family phage terminase large subunit [Inquilinus sp. Marseille-Q2685]|uniref:PBSX family phage terminase large subunit n=1 Tax=Inquilinus sp. Marseille-Q2685 TaxID=2866581 RepID=UPI001CE45314|nr:PBSX family phage terminase large subunit [Inquilinus sp. Marseille-Q2685]
MRDDLMGIKQSWVDFADHFTLYGDAKAAAIFARFDWHNANKQGYDMLKRPKVLILCFEAVAGRRQQGCPPPPPKVIRRLVDATEARLVPGATTGRAVADLARLDQAYREFRRDLGLDEAPLPPKRDAMPAAAEPPALPLLDLAPAFRPLQRRCRYKGAYGGRGSGKSHVFAELLVRRCVEAAPVRAVCIREVQRSLDQSVKRLIEDKIQALGLGAAFRVQADRILAPGGGRIIFQGMQNHTAESIKSLEGYDIAWVEEAQALSIRSLDLLRPTIRKPGSELWFSWNPVRPDDPVDALFRGGPLPPDCELVPVNWSDNPHFPEVLKAEMEWDRQRDPEKHQHVWLGGYRRVSEARVFTNWKVEAFETPAGARFLFGADWGFARDPTVLVRCFVQGRTLFVDHEAYQVGCEIDRTPALFDTVPGARRGPIIADSARPETISYMQRQGFGAIKGSAKGPGSVEEGVEFLKAHDILVHPRCRHLIDELALYSYRTDPKTGAILSELEDRGNHAVDALRYAVEGQRRSTYDTSMKWV